MAGISEPTPGPSREARTSEAPLALEGIEKTWGDQVVLRGANLTLAPGRVTALGGRNGAGKTTLMRIASGLICADGGSVSLRGLDPDADRRAYQRHLGYLPAGNGGLYARLTVRQNLEFWGSLALLTGAERLAAVQRVLHLFDLSELEHKRTDRISMGQRQRVRIAATFLHDPDVVLLDEPHTSLDDEARALLERALGQLAERGGAALWSAPSAEQVGLGYDDAWVVKDGMVDPA